MKKNTKKLIYTYPSIIGFLLKIYNKSNLFNNKLYGENRLLYKVALLKVVKFNIKGSGNIIIIDDFSRLIDCQITIFGNDNIIRIGQQCTINKVEFYMDGDKNEIKIGAHTHISGRTHLATIESTKILIGENCLFSRDIHFRTGDSHSITNLNGERINVSDNISIGNHCWIGYKVTCLKGTVIENDTIVGATSTLNKKFDQTNCIIAGVPAKIVKTGVNWNV